MKLDKYKQISTFYVSHVDISQFEKDFVIRKVFENYYKQIYTIDINGHETKKSELEIDAIESTLVSLENLQSYLDSASSFYNSWVDGQEKIFDKNNKKGSFWKSVWIGIVSNGLYSLLLILFFILAKSQITSWLQSLLE